MPKLANNRSAVVILSHRDALADNKPFQFDGEAVAAVYKNACQSLLNNYLEANRITLADDTVAAPFITRIKTKTGTKMTVGGFYVAPKAKARREPARKAAGPSPEEMEEYREFMKFKAMKAQSQKTK